MKRLKNFTINWTEIAERVPENQVNSFKAFKAKAEAHLNKMLKYPEEPPKIEWEYYRKIIPNNALVEEFRKKYEALKIPFPKDTVTPLIEEQERQANLEVAEFIKNSNARVLDLEKELKRLESIMPFEMMTMEDFKDAFPEHAIDTFNRPTFWPHTPEEQLDYEPPEAVATVPKAELPKSA